MLTPMKEAPSSLMRVKADDRGACHGRWVMNDSGPANPPPSAPAAPAASVFLPKEHGSWSLALEPLLLGLLVAPTPAGGAIAAAALACFLARRPLRASLEAEASPRRRSSRAALAAASAVASAGLLEAAVLARPSALWPLLVAGSFGAGFLLFDLRREPRAAAAEVAGTAAFACLPAAFATAAGWPAAPALALSGVMLARSLPTVLAVRSFLRMAKGRPSGVLAPVLSALLALILVTALAHARLAPWWAAALTAVLLVRTLLVFTGLLPAWPARRVGLTEAGIGLAYVVSAALAYRG